VADHAKVSRHKPARPDCGATAPSPFCLGNYYCRLILVKFEGLGAAATHARPPASTLGNNRAFTAVKKIRCGRNHCTTGAFAPSGGVPTMGHQGVSRMAGSGPVSGNLSAYGVARSPSPTGGRGMLFCRARRSIRLRPAKSLDTSIAEFPSATFLPCNSKIAVRPSCRHDRASTLVTSCWLSRHNKPTFSRSGGTHAAQQ